MKKGEKAGRRRRGGTEKGGGRAGGRALAFHIYRKYDKPAARMRGMGRRAGGGGCTCVAFCMSKLWPLKVRCRGFPTPTDGEVQPGC